MPYLSEHVGPYLPASFTPLGIFVGAITAAYIGVGLVGPTQSALCLRILSHAGLSQHEVAAALAAANVTFSTLGSLCGPLVAGWMVPDVYSFREATSLQAASIAICYLPGIILLARFKPGYWPGIAKWCGPAAVMHHLVMSTFTCCSFFNSCICPCLPCCIEEPEDDAPQQMESADPRKQTNERTTSFVRKQK